MSFLFGSSDDPLIDEATSETIPYGTTEIAKNFEIADKIKSNALAPKKALQQLQKRLQNKNPNVQLLALELIDVCIKNSGILFLQQVCTAEFLEAVEQLLITNTPTVVKEKILYFIQEWHLLFINNPELYQMQVFYNSLRQKNYSFPRTNTTSNKVMIETVLAPPWTDSESCTRCRIQFSTFNRKHHCRNCGQVFCQDCSGKVCDLPALGITDQVRVCETCFGKLKSGVPAGGSKPQPQPQMNHPVQSAKEDEEFERAIQESLKLSEQKTTVPKKTAFQTKHDHSDDDEDLRKAIQESLAFSTSRDLTYSTKITKLELENIKKFCELIESNSSIDQLTNMYSVINGTQRKLVVEIETLAGRYKELYELNQMCSEALAAYDSLMRQRFGYRSDIPSTSGSYQAFQHANHYPIPQQHLPPQYQPNSAPPSQYQLNQYQTPSSTHSQFTNAQQYPNSPSTQYQHNAVLSAQYQSNQYPIDPTNPSRYPNSQQYPNPSDQYQPTPSPPVQYQSTSSPSQNHGSSTPQQYPGPPSQYQPTQAPPVQYQSTSSPSQNHGSSTPQQYSGPPSQYQPTPAPPVQYQSNQYPSASTNASPFPAQAQFNQGPTFQSSGNEFYNPEQEINPNQGRSSVVFSQDKIYQSGIRNEAPATLNQQSSQSGIYNQNANSNQYQQQSHYVNQPIQGNYQGQSTEPQENKAQEEPLIQL